MRYLAMLSIVCAPAILRAGDAPPPIVDVRVSPYNGKRIVSPARLGQPIPGYPCNCRITQGRCFCRYSRYRQDNSDLYGVTVLGTGTGWVPEIRMEEADEHLYGQYEHVVQFHTSHHGPVRMMIKAPFHSLDDVDVGWERQPNWWRRNKTRVAEISFDGTRYELDIFEDRSTGVLTIDVDNK